MRTGSLVLAAALALSGCSSSSTAAPDARVVDLVLADRGGDRPGSVEARADLKPDQPKIPAHWKTVPGASLPMQGHSVTMLQNGEVLIVGGYRLVAGNYTTLSKAYRYLPATDTIVEAGELAKPRFDHSATLLPDGRVLVTGGDRDYDYYLVDTEIFDPAKPAATAWSAGPTLPEPRRGSSAILLPSGEVMFSGGTTDDVDPLGTAIFFNPGTGAWKLGASPLKEKRRRHTSTLLPGDKVLLSGGSRGKATSQVYLSSLEIYDLKTGASSLLTASMSKPRTFHSATVLDDGRVLIVGGVCGGGDCGQLVDDLYDPKTDTIAPLTHPGGYPGSHVAAKLLDGRLLITANDEGSQHLVVAYDAKASPPGWESLPNMPHPRYAAEGVRLQDGSVLVVGGIATSSPYAYADQVDRFFP